MAWQESKRYAQVHGRRMAYVERGSGSPIVLLHGNPTSSYVWRSVLAQLEDLGRCIALDLIGMGDSDKLPANDERRYTFMRHREFLDALLDQLGVTSDVTLVLHDWGSALGFDWAYRHPNHVRAIAYMEAFVTPLTWDDYDPKRREVFETHPAKAAREMAEGVLDADATPTDAALAVRATSLPRRASKRSACNGWEDAAAPRTPASAGARVLVTTGSVRAGVA